MKLIFRVIVLGCLLSFVGCQKTLNIDAVFDKGSLVFFIKDKPKNITLTLYTIEVYRNDCTVNCTYWQLQSVYNESGFKQGEVIRSYRIPYGLSTRKLNPVVVAKALEPGDYTLTADAVVNEYRGSGIIYHFSIKIDASGERYVQKR